MDWLFVMVVILSCLAFVLALGLTIVSFVGAPDLCMREAAKNRGPSSIRWGGLLATALLGLLGGLFGFLAGILYTMHYYLFDDSLLWKFAIGGAVLYAVIEAVIAVFSAHGIAEGIRLQKRLAPQVASFALEHFAAILEKPDAVITEQDLNDATGNEELLAQMRTYLSEIGHVTSSYKTTQTSFIMVGTSMIPTISTVTHNTYGISKTDLEAYPSKIADMFAKW